MLQKTYYSSGKDDYKDHTFSAQEWSAPYMVDPIEIRSRLDSLKLEGRTIKSLKLIGLSYPHVRDWIEEHAYVSLEQFEEEERHLRSEYRNIAGDIQYARYAEIDEPILIKFEDGSIFEIETPQEPEFRFSMDCIPWSIGAGTNMPNLDANIMFSPCIGRTIKHVEVKTYFTEKDPMFFDFIDEEHSKHELVSSIVLRLDDGTGICVEGHIDFCEVSMIDKKDEILHIPFQELKQGLFNWEDLHIDEECGFKSNSGTLFFGNKGAEHVDHPYITLEPEGKRFSAHITYTDFLLLELAITWLIKEPFDEYEDYDFSADQWEQVLQEADRILSYESFDDLFDYLTDLDAKDHSGGHGFLALLNAYGARFWKRREIYRTQMDDVQNWTKLVMLGSETMKVRGF